MEMLEGSSALTGCGSKTGLGDRDWCAGQLRRGWGWVRRWEGNTSARCSESSLGFGDVDLDTVGALCCRVLPEGGSAPGLQQPPPRFCPLTVPEVHWLIPDGQGVPTDARHHQAPWPTSSSTSGNPIPNAISPEAATHPTCWLLW